MTVGRLDSQPEKEEAVKVKKFNSSFESSASSSDRDSRQLMKPKVKVANLGSPSSRKKSKVSSHSKTLDLDNPVKLMRSGKEKCNPRKLVPYRKVSCQSTKFFDRKIRLIGIMSQSSVGKKSDEIVKQSTLDFDLAIVG